MRSVSTLALACGAAVLAPAVSVPAAAQTAELGSEERAAFLAAQTALQARDYAAAAAAIGSARSQARSGPSRYLAAALELRLAVETGNFPLQGSAIDAMIASGAAPPAVLPTLYRNQGALARNAGKLANAETAFARWAELAPNDAEPLVTLAQLKIDRRKPQEAVALLDRAVRLRRAAAQPVPEAWIKRGLSVAMMNRMAPQSLGFARELAAGYPTAENWRDVILTYRDAAAPDPAALLDALRLQRAARALAGERDYLQLAQALNAAGLSAETKAVLEEGIAAKMVDPAKASFRDLLASARKQAAAERTGLAARETTALAAATGAPALAVADSLFGQGDYAKAATLYRAALQKGTVDANSAGTRLGLALGLAGQRIEAEAALRAVSGPRAELASLLLIWLGQRG